MTLILETAPDVDVVSLDEMKAHIRQDGDLGTSEDDVIQTFIEAATRKLDGRDGLLGRCLITQAWTLTLDRFPAEIAVPLPPCQSVDSITYFDDAGVSQTLSADTYQVAGIGAAEGARIVPAYGKSWPSTRRMLEAVTVHFTAGYGDDPDDVPEPIRTAIKMHVAHLHENRESVLVGNGMMALELPQGASDLLMDYRVWGF